MLECDPHLREKEGTMQTRLDRLRQRLENIALVAEDVRCPTQIDDMRQAIQILFNLLGTILVDMRQGLLNTDRIFTSEMLPLIAEEQQNVARQAIQAAQQMAIFAYRDEVAKQMGQELDLATSLEALSELEAQCMEKEEQAMLAEFQRLGQATARLEVMEAM